MTRTRVFAALLMVPLAVLPILLLPTPWMAAVAAVLVLAALWEWLRLAEIDDTLQRTILLTLNLVLMVLMLWAARGSLVLLEIVAVLGVGWWLLAVVWLRFHGFASDHDTHARAFKLAAGTLATLAAWSALVLIHGGQPGGHRWLLAALAVVWAADSGAYFAGRRFGKHKLSPRISPNKTVEGLVGGLLAALVAGLLVGWFAGAAPAQLPALALVVFATVLFSVVGDLFESLLKRHVGAKDSGTLIPGHGGILDRLDGVLAALPAFWLGKEVLGL